jgi:hypothetical protein
LLYVFFARILDVTIANTIMISLSLCVHRVDAFSRVFHARRHRAQFRSAVVKRRFEAGDLTASTPHIPSSPRLPVAGAIYFPDISAAHLARIFDYCRTEWPSDRVDASARYAVSQRHSDRGVEEAGNEYIKSSCSFPLQITKYTFVSSFCQYFHIKCDIASQPSISMPIDDSHDIGLQSAARRRRARRVENAQELMQAGRARVARFRLGMSSQFCNRNVCW